MRVVITGYGAVTPLGNGVEALWSGLLEGRSGIAELPAEGGLWDVLPVRVGAAVPFDVVATLGAVKARRVDRSQQFALLAAQEAWDGAGAPEVDGDRFAVVVGTGIGGVETLLTQDDVLEASGARRVSPRAVPMLMPNGASAQVSIEFGARAGTFTTASACASGAEAIAMGARLIREGDADIVIAGGVEAAVTPLTMAAFAQSQALAKPDELPVDRLSRPFDVTRHGFVLGEGAGLVVLESEAHAAARGARARVVLGGFGVTSDAFHITATEPDGRGQARAMAKAMRMAELEPTDIVHVNAHATSTPVGDVSEAASVRAAIGEHVTVTAPKSAIGHLVGGAGAVEAIIAAKSVETGLVPPTRNLTEIDPEIGLDVVTGAPREGAVPAAISNSFGFGGQNVSLALQAV